MIFDCVASSKQQFFVIYRYCFNVDAYMFIQFDHNYDITFIRKMKFPYKIYTTTYPKFNYLTDTIIKNVI
jgi:hypothetical protein